MKIFRSFLLLLILLLSYAGEADSIGLKTVVIDAGHGGSDKGGEGKSGLVEKDVALQVSLSLKQMILNNLKLNVVMTRDGDGNFPLEKRAAAANKSKGDFLVSIHTGSAYSSELSGIGIYYLDYEETRKDMGIETANNGDEEEEANLILKDMIHSDYASEGAKIADLIHKNLTEIIPDQKIILKPMPILILKEVDMPSVMIEVGNITNPEDAKRLRDREYVDKIARAIVKALKEYIGR